MRYHSFVSSVKTNEHTLANMRLILIYHFCLTTLFLLASPNPLLQQPQSIHLYPNSSPRAPTHPLSARAPIPVVSYTISPITQGWTFHLLTLDTIIYSAAGSSVPSVSLITSIFSAFYAEARQNAITRWPLEMRPMPSFMIGKGNIRVDFASQFGPIPWTLVVWWAEKMGSMSRLGVAGRYRCW